MKGEVINQKKPGEYGKQVWILINKEEKVVERFVSKKNALQFKSNSAEELKLERI